MTWQIITAANLVIAAAYFSISYIIASGLIRTGQLSTNKLGLATALIFFTCGVHHGTHAVHMLLPAFGVDDQQALNLRASWHWESAVWDIATAMVGVYYLSLRGSYSSVLRGAQMFEDLKVRERQALEINDSIVQGLTVAKYQLDRGADGKSRDAIEETLRKARGLISELLDEPGAGPKITEPGDLRRASAATVSQEK
jgi:signal transduction histidine kinase